MSRTNPKDHIIEDGIILFQSKHFKTNNEFDEIIEVDIDTETRIYCAKLKDGTKKYTEFNNGRTFREKVILYKIDYCFQSNSWRAGYYNIENQELWKNGFKTAREAWLYREVLVNSKIATKEKIR